MTSPMFAVLAFGLSLGMLIGLYLALAVQVMT